MLIFDAHLDLSFNAISYNRDLRMELNQIRKLESGMLDLAGRGSAAVSLPEMRKAGIGICVATQLAGCMKPSPSWGGWNSPEQAWAMTQGQLAWYRSMEQEGSLRSIRDCQTLQSHLQQWQTDSAACPIGYILSLEGADSFRTLDDLHAAHGQGLRAVGPAHYGVGRYALGHDQDGPLSAMGQSLLREMDSLKMILDVTHLSEATFWQALDIYQGHVWASHHNCRALVDDPRQLSDRQIIALADRDAVIGVAFDVWMVVPDWVRGRSNHNERDDGNLAALADHVDHVCQLLGNVNHVGIGTDLDGGFGTEQTPSDLDSIADLKLFVKILRNRGYSEDDLNAIASKNFLRLLQRAWS